MTEVTLEYAAICWNVSSVKLQKRLKDKSRVTVPFSNSGGIAVGNLEMLKPLQFHRNPTFPQSSTILCESGQFSVNNRSALSVNANIHDIIAKHHFILWKSDYM